MKVGRVTRGRRRAIAVGLAALPVIAAAGMGSAASAATVYWDIDGATFGSGPDDTPTGTWNASNAFWTTDTSGLGPHSAWVSGDTAAFSASTDADGAFTVTVSGTQIAGGLNFQEGTVTLAGGTLSLNGSASVDVGIFRSATINSVISGSAGFTKTGSGTLTLGGVNTFTGAVNISGAGPLRIAADSQLGNTNNDVTISNGGDLVTTASIAFPSTRVFTLGTFGGVIAPAVGTIMTINSALAANANALTMNGQGTLVLTTASTRTGTTTISNGTLRITSATALGTAGSGSVAINAGGTLDIDSVALDKPLTLNNGATLRASFADSLGAATVASGAAVTINVFSAPFTFGNAANDLTGGGPGSSITVTGGNFLELLNDSDYVGNWIVSGLVQVDSDASLGNAANGVTLDNGRVFASTGFSSARAVTLAAGGGSLQIGSSQTLTLAGVISGNGPLTKMSSGTLVLSGANTFTGLVAVTGGTLSIDADARLGSVANDVTLDNGTLATTATMTAGSGRGFTLGSGGGTFSVAASTTLTLEGAINGTGSLNKTGAGTLVLLNPVTSHSGGTTISQGTLRVGTLGALPDTGPVALANAAGALLDVNGADEITGTLSGGGAAGGNILLAGGSLSIEQAADSTFAGTIAGPGVFSKSGLNPLVISRSVAPDTTIIASGPLTLAVSNILSGDVLVGKQGVFDVNGMTESIGMLLGLGQVTLGSGALTVNMASSQQYGGLISGSGSLTKAGGGALTLSGDNTYTGETTITSGLLAIGAGGTSGSVAGNIVNNGALRFDRSDNLTFGGVISGSGALTKDGAGTLVLTGISPYSGSTFVEEGSLRVVGGGAVGASFAVVVGDDAGADSVLDVSGGTVTAGAAGMLVRSDGELRIGAGGRVNTNSLARISAGGLFSVAIGGKLDLTDEKFIADSAAVGGVGTFAGGSYSGLSALVQSGYNGGAWNGSGIITSDARAINNGDLVSIGVATVTDLRNIDESETTTFAGQTVMGSDVVAMVTWGGDANLDGKINIDDYGRIDGNVGQSGSVFGWSRGDFNYDGKINIDDYGIIDGNINRQGAPFAAGARVDEAIAVPEPGGVAFVAMGALGPAMRRRRAAAWRHR